jgi:TonB family protein
LYKIETSSAASGEEESITINLQEFNPASAAAQESPEQATEIADQESDIATPQTQENLATDDSPKTDTTESLEEQTRKLFEKIAHAENETGTETAPPEQTILEEAKVVEESTPKKEEDLEALTKKLFKKIADSAKKPIEQKSKTEPILPNKPQQNITPLQETLLAKQALELMEQNRQAKEKSFEEKLAKAQRIEDTLKKEALIKAEKEKQAMLAKLAAAKEQERLAKEAQEKAQRQKAQALAKAKEEALEKAKLAKQAEQAKAEAEAEKKAKAKLTKIEQKKQKKLKEKKRKEAARKAQLAKIEKHKAKLAAIKKKKAQRAKAKKIAKAKKAKELGKKRKQHASKDALANALSKHSKTRTSKRRVSSSTRRMISRFYGSEFNGFSGTQKKFIEENLGNIYVITQRVLSRRGYPDVAIKTRQSGVQLVTFYLHPNGRISGLRLKKRIGYASLDKNTLQVVRIAHANYPRPKTTTKITFYVEYNLD